MYPEISIGTAQFGLKYGITNKKGIIDFDEAKKIFKTAELSGIRFIDTAQDYGMAEENIGKSLSNSRHQFKITSKLSVKCFQENDVMDINLLERRFLESLRKLKLNKLDSFLIHDASILSKPNISELMNWLKSLRIRNLVNNIGVSIYKYNDLNGIKLDDFQLVQLPLSIYDQRCINNGLIDKLHEKGIKIHARSIFLQGLILQDPKNWPDFLSEEFFSHHRKFSKNINLINSNKLSEAIRFVLNNRKIEAFIIGISSLEEFICFLEKFNEIKNGNDHFLKDVSKYSWNNEYDLDPRLWLNKK